MTEFYKKHRHLFEDDGDAPYAKQFSQLNGINFKEKPPLPNMQLKFDKPPQKTYDDSYDHRQSPVIQNEPRRESYNQLPQQRQRADPYQAKPDNDYPSKNAYQNINNAYAGQPTQQSYQRNLSEPKNMFANFAKQNIFGQSPTEDSARKQQYEYKQDYKQQTPKMQNDYLDDFVSNNDKRYQKPPLNQNNRVSPYDNDFKLPPKDPRGGFGKENFDRPYNDSYQPQYGQRFEIPTSKPINSSFEGYNQREVNKSRDYAYEQKGNSQWEQQYQAPPIRDKYKNQSQFNFQEMFDDPTKEDVKQRQRGGVMNRGRNTKVEEAGDSGVSNKQHRFPFDDYNTVKRKFISQTKNFAQDQDVLIKKQAIMLELNSRKGGNTQEDQRYKEAMIRRMIAGTRQDRKERLRELLRQTS